MTQPDVSVVVVSFNTREETLACLRSVFVQTVQSRFEVIVVDNDSQDGSAKAIASQFPQCQLICPGQNLGFAAANNLAAERASGEYLLLLNPDTVVLDGAIDRIVSFARRNPGAATYGGRTFFGDMTLNPSSCHGRPTPWSLFCIGVGLSTLFRRSKLFNPEGLGPWRRDTVREVDCVTGCFLLMRRDLWNKLGGFDLDFFMYGEDTDLCIRASQMAGPCLVCPDATIIHYEGRSERIRADRMVRLFRAKVQLFEKHWSPPWVRFGVLMLESWAATRAVVLWLVARFAPDRRLAYEAWREVFRRRSEYQVSSKVIPAYDTRTAVRQGISNG